MPIEQMNITLPPKMARFIRSKVKTGQYTDASEVVRDAVRHMQAAESAEIDWLRREVRAGFDDIENGDYTDYDDAGLSVLADRVKARGRGALRPERRAKTAKSKS